MGHCLQGGSLGGEAHLTEQWVSAVGAVKADNSLITLVRASFNGFELHRSSEGMNSNRFGVNLSNGQSQSGARPMHWQALPRQLKLHNDHRDHEYFSYRRLESVCGRTR
jgi:hypothetical protein